MTAADLVKYSEETPRALQWTEAEEEEIFELIGNALSENTRRAYRVALKTFAEWCEARDATVVPAAPETLAAYITYRRERETPVSTLAVALAAIRYAHKRTGHPSPTTNGNITEIVRGYRRERAGDAPDRRRGLTVKELEAMVKTCDDSPHGLRDAALLALGFYGGFRRSELVGVDVEHIARLDGGRFAILVPVSKTDQIGEGMVKAFSPKPGRVTCPQRRLSEWLGFRGEERGPLFCTVHRTGAILRDGADTPKRLSAKDVTRILRRRAKLAGIDAKGLSAHSLRIGFVTEARRRDASDFQIRKQTGHKTSRMIDVYTRTEDAHDMNAESLL